ncbi:unnamed protein product [Linum trigynum]|uniref:Uncharacterized protein n=1 Tax=Linum trigynum TaxID=586398 RepID=A0AAV2CJX1_9ROSI
MLVTTTIRGRRSEWTSALLDTKRQDARARRTSPSLFQKRRHGQVNEAKDDNIGGITMLVMARFPFRRGDTNLITALVTTLSPPPVTTTTYVDYAQLNKRR